MTAALPADQPFPPALFRHYDGVVYGYDCRPLYAAMMRVNGQWEAAVVDRDEDRMELAALDAESLLDVIDGIAAGKAK